MSRGAAVMVYALILIGLFAYAQPWIVADAGALSLNAYDLAEWASLVPAQRATTPPLLAPLLLRMQLAISGGLLGAIAAGRGQKLISAAAIALLAVAQLPPAEFVLDINNVNYRQQFALAALSLVAGGGLLLALRRASTLLPPALATIGLATSALGLSEALALYRGFKLEAAPGAGLWLLCFELCGRDRHRHSGAIDRAPGATAVMNFSPARVTRRHQDFQREGRSK